MDSFFFLSGFLAAYLMIAKFYPKKGKANYWVIYFHRFYRLLPPVIVLTLIASYLYVYFSGGPMWMHFAGEIRDNCRKYWW